MNLLLPDGFPLTVIAVTSEIEKRKGLSGISFLPQTCGMLFVYDRPGFHQFWMAGCLIPLDIVWMDADKKVVEVAQNCPPVPNLATGTPPMYGGNQPAQYILEIGAGQAHNHGLVLGAEVKW